jgi:hypothetical protein
MAQHKWLHVLFLENSKWFFHTTTSNTNFDIFAECQLLFDFVQMNKPLFIYQSDKYIDSIDTDSKVKRYMKQYGIENVRGGSYSASFLPFCLENALTIELCNNIENEKKQEVAIQFIQSIQQQDHLSKSDILKSLQKYHHIQEKYCLFLDVLFPEDKHTSIHSLIVSAKQKRTEIREGFAWLQNVLYHYESQEFYGENKLQKMKKYNKLLIEIKKIVPFVLANCPLADSFPLPLVFLSHPEFIFDLFIYHAKPEKWEQNLPCYVDAVELFYYLEYIKNVFCNRMEEEEFDISCYSSTFEKECEITIDYIQENHIIGSDCFHRL